VATATIVLLFALIAVVVAWLLSTGFSAGRVVWAVVLTVPLWLPIYGVLRSHRKTFAWATLCVIPYFILGVTEAIANPERRIWSGLCLGLALALFVALILYLRITNRARIEAN
jgi:uncharacterized membrane protein